MLALGGVILSLVVEEYSFNLILFELDAYCVLRYERAIIF